MSIGIAAFDTSEAHVADWLHSYNGDPNSDENDILRRITSRDCRYFASGGEGFRGRSKFRAAERGGEIPAGGRVAPAIISAASGRPGETAAGAAIAIDR